MQNINNYDFAGKRAIVRVDFNVPLNVDAYMSDDEYSDVYDLDEGGKTENIIASEEEIIVKSQQEEKADIEYQKILEAFPFFL